MRGGHLLPPARPELPLVRGVGPGGEGDVADGVVAVGAPGVLHEGGGEGGLGALAHVDGEDGGPVQVLDLHRDPELLVLGAVQDALGLEYQSWQMINKKLLKLPQ